MALSLEGPPLGPLGDIHPSHMCTPTLLAEDWSPAAILCLTHQPAARWSPCSLLLETGVCSAGMAWLLSKPRPRNKYF